MPINTLGQLNPDDSLRIFDSFVVDSSLPKFAQAVTPPTSRAELIGTTTISLSANPWIVQGDQGGTNPPPRRFAWLWDLFQAPPEKATPVTEVFATIKASATELTEWDERDKVLLSVVARAQKLGQTALVKQLEAERGIRRFENVLYVKGRRKLITEAQLLEFTRKCERGLCLDWLRDFTRIIPEDVATEKIKCDEVHLFDNYVVLHYDPKNRGTSPEAREKARDPILFGVIRGSRKLYFVADWMDEQCDLTFQEIVTRLGKTLEIPTDPGQLSS